MKAIPVIRSGGAYCTCSIEQATHLRFKSPGFFGVSVLPIITHGTRQGTPCWTWNGDTESPTLRPSVRITDGLEVSHFWLNDGMVKFLGDSTHELAGQTCELLDIEPEQQEPAQ